jgi:hypothetical protein
MKQKVLTEKQHEVLGRLEAILKEAQENNIGFVYDNADGTLTAYNEENVDYGYNAEPRTKEYEEDVKIDWDSASIIKNFNANYFNCSYDEYYLHFKEE